MPRIDSPGKFPEHLREIFREKKKFPRSRIFFFFCPEIFGGFLKFFRKFSAVSKPKLAFSSRVFQAVCGHVSRPHRASGVHLWETLFRAGLFRRVSVAPASRNETIEPGGASPGLVKACNTGRRGGRSKEGGPAQSAIFLRYHLLLFFKEVGWIFQPKNIGLNTSVGNILAGGMTLVIVEV